MQSDFFQGKTGRWMLLPVLSVLSSGGITRTRTSHAGCHSRAFRAPIFQAAAGNDEVSGIRTALSREILATLSYWSEPWEMGGFSHCHCAEWGGQLWHVFLHPSGTASLFARAPWVSWTIAPLALKSQVPWGPIPCVESYKLPQPRSWVLLSCLMILSLSSHCSTSLIRTRISVPSVHKSITIRCPLAWRVTGLSRAMKINEWR